MNPKTSQNMTTDQITEHMTRMSSLRQEFNDWWRARTDLDPYTPGQRARLMIDAWREWVKNNTCKTPLRS